MTEVVPQLDQAVHAEVAHPCAGCVFAGEVKVISVDTAQLHGESYPGGVGTSTVDVTLTFEQDGNSTGEVIIRTEGKGEAATKAIAEAQSRIGSCAGSLQGRTSGLGGLLLRRQTEECGAFHRLEDNGVVYPHNVIEVINADQA